MPSSWSPQKWTLWFQEECQQTGQHNSDLLGVTAATVWLWIERRHTVGGILPKAEANEMIVGGRKSLFESFEQHLW